VTEQGYPPRQPGYPGRQGPARPPHQPRKTGWQVLDAFDDSADPESDLPPWAVPGGIAPLRPARRPPRPQPRSATAPRAPDLDRYGERGESGEPGGSGDPGRFGDPGEHDDWRQQGESGDYELTGPGRRIGQGRRSRRSRAAQARRRRSKRRLVTWGGTAVIVAALVLGGLWLTSSPAPKSPFVTTFQKGEFRDVPDACKILGSTELQALLKGTPKSVEPFKGAAHSQCAFTVDAEPTFRVLSLDVQAYPASLTAPGDGSATANARFAFAQQRNLLAKPPKGTAQPPATITAIHSLGGEAFSAVQVYQTGFGTDRVSVLVWYRNVLITASLMGESSGGFGPVTTAELGAGALSAARTAFAAVRAEPTVR
jgi:hypothetical protein